MDKNKIREQVREEIKSQLNEDFRQANRVYKMISRGINIGLASSVPLGMLAVVGLSSLSSAAALFGGMYAVIWGASSVIDHVFHKLEKKELKKLFDDLKTNIAKRDKQFLAFSDDIIKYSDDEERIEKIKSFYKPIILRLTEQQKQYAIKIEKLLANASKLDNIKREMPDLYNFFRDTIEPGKEGKLSNVIDQLRKNDTELSLIL